MAVAIWQVIDTMVAGVEPPVIPPTPTWLKIADVVVEVSPVVQQKAWMEIQQLMMEVTPLTPVSAWKLLATMSIEVAPTGVKPPTDEAEEEGKISSMWVWGSLAVVAVLVVIGMAGR